MWNWANIHQMFHDGCHSLQIWIFPASWLNLLFLFAEGQTVTKCLSGRCWHCSCYLIFRPREGYEIIEVLFWIQHWLVGFLFFWIRNTAFCWQSMNRPSWTTPALRTPWARSDSGAEDTEIRCLQSAGVLQVTFCDNPECHVIVQHGIQVQLFLKTTFSRSGVCNTVPMSFVLEKENCLPAFSMWMLTFTVSLGAFITSGMQTVCKCEYHKFKSSIIFLVWLFFKRLLI